MNTNLAFLDEPWYELIDGQTVLMTPRPLTNHIYVAGNIYRIFATFLKGKTCVPFPDGADLYLNEKDRFVPDSMIVCNPDIIADDGVHGAPDLVVEILSAPTVKRDRGYKKNAYEKAGVKEYWIVDHVNKSVEQYLLEANQLILHEVYSVYPDSALNKMKPEEQAAIPTGFKCSLYDDLIIQLADIFDRVK